MSILFLYFSKLGSSNDVSAKSTAIINLKSKLSSVTNSVKYLNFSGIGLSYKNFACFPHF